MNCQVIEEHLIEYIEGTLDPTLVEVYKKHLSSCQNCTNILFEVKKTYAILAKPIRITTNSTFTEETIERLNKKDAKVIQLFYQALKPIAVAASIGFGILIGNGELSVLSTSDSITETDNYIMSSTTPTDYSVWQSFNEEYGNQD